MTALQIHDIKDFMSKLLIKETFDRFCLTELSVTTSITYTIDGRLHPEFFNTEEAQLLTEDGLVYTKWQDVKPFCFSVIKGKQTPLHFKIVFILSPQDTALLLSQSGLQITCEDIFGLYLNCQYDNGELTCVTGTSLKFFTLDKSLDYAWDNMVRNFLKQQQITFEERY